jgi:hypothetical protein
MPWRYVLVVQAMFWKFYYQQKRQYEANPVLKSFLEPLAAVSADNATNVSTPGCFTGTVLQCWISGQSAVLKYCA